MLRYMGFQFNKIQQIHIKNKTSEVGEVRNAARKLEIRSRRITLLIVRKYTYHIALIGCTG